MVVVFDDVRHLEVKRVTSTNAKRIDVVTCGVQGDGVIDLVDQVSYFARVRYEYSALSFFEFV